LRKNSKIWELIFKLAKDLNIQVFATTQKLWIENEHGEFSEID
jgi:hypothetical protein